MCRIRGRETLRQTVCPSRRDGLIIGHAAAHLCGHFTGQPTRAPGGLEVVAADQAVDIEDLAGEVQAEHNPAFERCRINLFERDAARGYLGLREPQRSFNRQDEPFERFDEPVAFVARQLGAGAIRWDRRGG